MTESAAQILTRTATRWKAISHLPPDTRQYLMTLTDTELKQELKLLAKHVA